MADMSKNRSLAQSVRSAARIIADEGYTALPQKLIEAASEIEKCDSNDWQPIDQRTPSAKPIWVQTESGFECWAELFAWGCTGMCTPKGQPIHTPHMHRAWVMVNEEGDHLFTECGDMATVDPAKWRLK